MRTPDNLSYGVTVAGPILLIVTLVLVAASGWCWRWAKNNPDDSDVIVAKGMSIFLGVVALGFVIGSVIGYYPYQSEFHRWYKVDGEVQQIGNRQIADGSAMSTRYVFRIGNEDYGVDDTRATLVKVGDTVHLKCKREFVWNSVSGWACNWNG